MGGLTLFPVLDYDHKVLWPPGGCLVATRSLFSDGARNSFYEQPPSTCWFISLKLFLDHSNMSPSIKQKKKVFKEKKSKYKYMDTFGFFLITHIHHSLSHVWLSATPWMVALQAPPSMGFSRQEYWSGLLFGNVQVFKWHTCICLYIQKFPERITIEATILKHYI